MNQAKQKKGILFIISAPSGTGKTTLVKSLIERDPALQVSISHTTRPRRPNETEDVAYHFIDEARFEQMVADNIFLEYAKVFNCHYGTSRHWVDEHLSLGIDVVLEIDWQGAQQVRQAMTKTVSIFILPPSFQTLEQRLRDRGEDEQTVKLRMQDAENELKHYGEYDYLVVNEDFHIALEEIELIIRAMRHQYALQNSHFDYFAEQLLKQAANIK